MDKKYRLLLVDDSIEWLRSHLSMLEVLYPENMFDIEIATSAGKAFNKVIMNQDACFDIVITDLEMERIFDEDYAGIWLVRNLINRDECKNSKFIIISSAYNIQDIAKDLGVDFIPKSSLLSNEILLKYKIDEILGL